jgi:ABC transport system ATP-binding/permease protein
MNFLSVENISRSYGDRVLFDNLSFGLNQGDKVALIAANGAGKTTLLRIITGTEMADQGTVTIRNGVKTAFLQQDPVLDEDITIDEYIKNCSFEIHLVIRDYEEALNAQTENYNEETHKAFEIASLKMDEAEAWDYERRLKQLLDHFKIRDASRKINTLSGGEKKRLALALVLLGDPDLLILDEPTNHLDIEMIEWLENYLSLSNVTLLMVTHDRYFLDRVCNGIIELDNARLFHYKGNYEYFIEKKAEREEISKTETDKARKLMKRELEWLRKMPKARTTKSKSRIDAFYEIKQKAEQRKQTFELKLDIKVKRMGGKIMELKELNKQFDDLVILKNFNYVFKKGEKIGVIGDNGTGKTSFLNILTGDDIPDSGSIDIGETIKIGYYTQKGIILDEDKRIIDVVKDIAEVITLSDGSALSASQFLQHFMFTPAMQYSVVSKLSGGEKRRLYLLTVLMHNPNFLILDEPTNDLDLITLNKLEEFLMNFSGCMIMVSHDRYFIDKLSDHFFVFKGNGEIDDFYGTYEEYIFLKEEQEKAEKNTAQKKEIKKPDIIPEKKKLSYKENVEFENLVNEISALEKEKTKLENEINSWNSSNDEMNIKMKRLAEVSELIDIKSMRWLELSEFSTGA